jgi:tetratricopeptide (TPR) repeat protein
VQQIALIAAGCAGLMACAEGQPGKKSDYLLSAEYLSLPARSFLSQQAILLWQKFVLAFYSDERLGNAHFVMGLLHSQVGLPIEAIAEYKLVANRFSQMSLAPFALLHSSKLKASLRDYPGTREDLKQLVEQYPDVEIYGQAYLRLAQATMEAGLNDEAAQLYQRVFNFGLSDESKIALNWSRKRLYETKGIRSGEMADRYIDLAGRTKQQPVFGLFSSGSIQPGVGKISAGL